MILNKKRIIRERYPGWCAFDCLYFYIEKSYLLCSGSMKDNKILVKGARRSTDIEMDLGRMEKIEQGILKLS